MTKEGIPIQVELGAAAPQDESLADALEALASPVRLALLRQLRTPKALREVGIKARGRGRDAHERTLARQTVKEHLEPLLEIGVVLAREADRDYGPTVEYIVNHQKLFAIAEEFRSLARLRPADEPSEPTFRAQPGGSAFRLAGPCLVLVKGLDEGRTFSLPPPGSGTREWVIGRRRGADVPLDFDPFVSSENTSVVWEEGAYSVQDMPDSRNGTLLNFQALPRGQRRSLGHGDLIGVGRCLLMFHA